MRTPTPVLEAVESWYVDADLAMRYYGTFKILKTAAKGEPTQSTYGGKPVYTLTFKKVTPEVKQLLLYMGAYQKRNESVGLFEAEVECLCEANPVRALGAFLLSPLMKMIAKMRSGYDAVRSTALIWKDAQEETGENLNPSESLRRAVMVTKMAGEGLDAVPPSTVEHAIPEYVPEKPLKESLSVVTVVSFVLAIIGGLPMIVHGIEKLAKLLRLRRLARALDSVHHVLHAFEEGVVDLVIPDRLSYAVYKRTWARGFKVTPDLLDYEAYRAESEARHKVEKTMFSILLVYFAWHGLLGILESGATLLGAAEATATTVKAVEIARGVKNATEIVRGVA